MIISFKNSKKWYIIEGNNKEVIALISKDNKLSIITFILDINKQVIDVKEQKELKDNIVSMSKTYNGTKYEYKFVTKDNKFYEFVIDEDKNTTEKPKNSVGDVNLDGIVDVFDLVRIQKYVNKQVDLTKESIDNADINKDGNIDKLDEALLKKYLAGYKMDLPYLKYKAGDANLDGTVDIFDLVRIKKYISKQVELTDESKINADINLDGNIDETDSNFLKEYLAGNYDSLPIIQN